MKTIYLMFLSCLLLTVFSCKKAGFVEYSDVDRLQFGPSNSDLIWRSDYEKTWKWVDTTKSYSFFFEEELLVKDTLYFDIYTLGRVTDYDRPYKLIQTTVPNVENAVPNVHYQAFNDPTSANLYIVKAGQSHTRVPIVFLRDASLEEKPFILRFEVAPNEHFQPGQSTNIWRKAIVADRLLQPAAWDESATRYYWGKYSTVKHQFMIDVTGLRWDQQMMDELEYDETNYFASELKKALATYNREHPNDPLIDEFGEAVVFP